MRLIRHSVGRGGRNLRLDVLIVQDLLNQHMPQGMQKLVKDGIAGRKTTAAIEEFQRNVVRMDSPDGRVDPGGRTIRFLRMRAIPLLNELKIRPVCSPRTPKAEERRFIEEYLRSNFNLKGANFQIASTALTALGFAGDFFSIAETACEIVPLLHSSSGVISAIGTGLGIAGTITFPLSQYINLLDADQIGMRLAGMRAVAYATTAWAFNHPTPPKPSKVVMEVGTAKRGYEGSFERKREIQAWRDAANQTLSVLNGEVKRRKLKKIRLQCVFRAAGQHLPQKLCRGLLRGFERDVKGGKLLGILPYDKNVAVYETFKRNNDMVPYPM